jgi:prophage antirepressor-like protein
MNALTQNKNSISVVTFPEGKPDGERHEIRVAGTIANPHFFGSDVCKILDIKNLKDALQKLVDNTHKMELKTLIQETQRGLVYPSEVGCLNEPNMLGSFDLEKLSHNDGRAVVLSEPGLHQLLDGTKLHKHRKAIRSAVERWIWATKYESGAGLVDLFAFIRGSYLAFDICSDWFKDLWYPMSKSRPPPHGGAG